jgi:hypothetical protein
MMRFSSRGPFYDCDKTAPTFPCFVPCSQGMHTDTRRFENPSINQKNQNLAIAVSIAVSSDLNPKGFLPFLWCRVLLLFGRAILFRCRVLSSCTPREQRLFMVFGLFGFSELGMNRFFRHQYLDVALP